MYNLHDLYDIRGRWVKCFAFFWRSRNISRHKYVTIFDGEIVLFFGFIHFIFRSTGQFIWDWIIAAGNCRRFPSGGRALDRAPLRSAVSGCVKIPRSGRVCDLAIRYRRITCRPSRREQQCCIVRWTESPLVPSEMAMSCRGGACPNVTNLRN